MTIIMKVAANVCLPKQVSGKRLCCHNTSSSTRWHHSFAYMLKAALLSRVGFNLKRISSTSSDLIKRGLNLFYVFCCVRFISHPPAIVCSPMLWQVLNVILFLFKYTYEYSLLCCKSSSVVKKMSILFQKISF